MELTGLLKAAEDANINYKRKVISNEYNISNVTEIAAGIFKTVPAIAADYPYMPLSKESYEDPELRENYESYGTSLPSDEAWNNLSKVVKSVLKTMDDNTKSKKVSK